MGLIKQFKDYAGNSHQVHTDGVKNDNNQTLTTLLGLKANSSDVYTKGQVDTALVGKANDTHYHAISDVTGLSTTLRDRCVSACIDGTLISLDSLMPSNNKGAAFVVAKNDGEESVMLSEFLDPGSRTIQYENCSASDVVSANGEFSFLLMLVATAGKYIVYKIDGLAKSSETYTKSQVDTALSGKADADDVYSKNELNEMFNLRAPKAKFLAYNGTKIHLNTKVYSEEGEHTTQIINIELSTGATKISDVFDVNSNLYTLKCDDSVSISGKTNVNVFVLCKCNGLDEELEDYTFTLFASVIGKF